MADLVGWESLDPNELICCPYDPAHRFLRKKLQYHLLKDHPNVKSKEYICCPFNASHQTTRQEFTYHVENCPDRARVETELINTTNRYRVKGNTAVPLPAWQPPDSSENWDEDDQEVRNQDEVDLTLEDQRGSGDRGKRVALPLKPTPAPPPVVRMPTGPSIADAHSPRKGLGRGRGRAYIAPPPGLSRSEVIHPKPETPQGTRSVHHLAGQYQMFSEGVRLPRGGPSAFLPGYVGVGRGLNPKLQRAPAGAQSPPSSTQKTPPQFQSPEFQSPQLQSPITSDAASFASTDSEDEELKSVQNRVRKLRKMLRQIEKIEEKESLAIPLQDEQIAKLRRKGDVLSSLRDAEEELRRLRL